MTIQSAGEKTIYSVETLNQYIKDMFRAEIALHDVSVRGEISNCKYHGSGHIYFTLKDENSSIPAVMFRGSRAGGLDFTLENGLEVEVRGSVEVYERDGKYQLYARQIKRGDIGDLARRFEELKKRLEREGLFDPAIKSPIPKDVKRLGVVTATTGAAIRDIISVSKRRNPYIEIIVYPAKVQGEGAKDSIVAGIQALENYSPDVIIVGRGGGSIEDLWAFNEECVAQAIFNCPIPVISAVGHETDFTIADFVADLRAPTPSAAAEIAVEELRPKLDAIDAYREELTKVMYRRIRECREKTKTEDRFLRDMTGRINVCRLRADKEDELYSKIMHKIALCRMRAGQYERRYTSENPARKIKLKKDEIVRLKERMNLRMEKLIESRKHELAVSIERFKRLSVLDRLQGGLGYVSDTEGKRKVSVKQFAEDEEFILRLKDGTVNAKVLHIAADNLEAFTKLQIKSGEV